MEIKIAEKNLLIPQGLRNDLMNYLATRPYGEVFKRMAALQALLPENSDAKKATGVTLSGENKK